MYKVELAELEGKFVLISILAAKRTSCGFMARFYVDLWIEHRNKGDISVILMIVLLLLCSAFSVSQLLKHDYVPVGSRLVNGIHCWISI